MKNFILVTYFSLHTLRCTTIFQLPEFLVQNSLSVPTQVFQECGVQSTSLAILRDFGFELFHNSPPPASATNENLARLRDFGFELVWSIPPPQGTYVGAGVKRLIAKSPQGLPSRSGYSSLMLYLERYNF